MAQLPVDKDYIDEQITRIKNIYVSESYASRSRRNATIYAYDSLVKTINLRGTAQDLEYLNEHIQSVDIPKTTVFTGPSTAGGKRKSKRKLQKRKTRRR